MVRRGLPAAGGCPIARAAAAFAAALVPPVASALGANGANCAGGFATCPDIDSDGSQLLQLGRSKDPWFWESNVKVPAAYYPHFDTTPDYLGISARAAGVGGNAGRPDDNFYLSIADSGGCASKCNGCCDRQREVAEMMKKYVRDRKVKHPNSRLLFVLASGDNFYWTGVGEASRFRDTWIDIYGPELAGVPWFAVMGNHDYGNDDGGAACPFAKPRFVCNSSNSQEPACGGPSPYSTQEQAYDSNQLDAGKGGLGGAERTNWVMPDYTYFYTIPALDFELIAMDWNSVDLEGLGGGPIQISAERTVEKCGGLLSGVDNIGKFMKHLKEASSKILNDRAKLAASRNVAIMGHYPPFYQQNVDFYDMYRDSLPAESLNNTKVYSFFGHTHTQKCIKEVGGECVSFQTGGAGGCCFPIEVPGGFTSITWNDDLTQKIDCWLPDVRCTLTGYGQDAATARTRAQNDGEAADVCSHTFDAPGCPSFVPPRGGAGH